MLSRVRKGARPGGAAKRALSHGALGLPSPESVGRVAAPLGSDPTGIIPPRGALLWKARSK